MQPMPIIFHSALILLMAGLFACTPLQSEHQLPKHHLALFNKRPPLCTDCHKPRTPPVQFERFNHTAYFLKNHRQEASQAANLCTICHQPQFCNDCHGVGTPLKPSIKQPTEPFRRLQHRGDYLSRHRIDARIDPSSCIRCHGNPKTARTCARCHG